MNALIIGIIKQKASNFTAYLSLFHLITKQLR